MPTAADLAEHEAHRGHPAPLTGRCNVGACRRFPIQGKWQPGGYHDQPYGTVPWSVAEVAYAAYAARHGRDQSLERIAERGGFGHEEMDLYAPGWLDSFESAP